ncbi:MULTISPECIES: hypothetical protein [Ahrensia]|uniref:Uncharacterized protein n=1 Tax=Ahrensia kielensis TaxID=76980 RepID=A0ABU9T1T3_9HYPH|nr:MULTISPECIES: hypothetical protein [Ahrensia]
MAVRAITLSIAMIAATALWGLSVYSADAMAGKVSHDGYGVSSITQN